MMAAMAAVPSPLAMQAAALYLRAYLPPTRLATMPGLPALKLECELPTGSFKPRGALFSLSRRLKIGPVREVIASSTGNHGAAVAWAAKTLGVPATIFLPAHPNPVKRDNIRGLGARLVEVAAPDISGAAEAATEYARRDGVFYLNDASDPDVPAGTATIGLEMLDQMPDIEAVFVPMGDTALIRGVAAAIKHRKPGVRITGVQAERAPSYALSWRAGHPIGTDRCDTSAGGLATRTPLPENVTAIRMLVDDVRLVSEPAMLAAVRVLHARAGVLAELSGAAAMAAFLQQPVSRAAALVTGANIAPEIRSRAGL